MSSQDVNIEWKRQDFWLKKNYPNQSKPNQSNPNQSNPNQSNPSQSNPNQKNWNFLESPRAPWSCLFRWNFLFLRDVCSSCFDHVSWNEYFQQFLIFHCLLYFSFAKHSTIIVFFFSFNSYDKNFPCQLIHNSGKLNHKMYSFLTGKGFVSFRMRRTFHLLCFLEIFFKLLYSLHFPTNSLELLCLFYCCLKFIPFSEHYVPFVSSLKSRNTLGLCCGQSCQFVQCAQNQNQKANWFRDSPGLSFRLIQRYILTTFDLPKCVWSQKYNSGEWKWWVHSVHQSPIIHFGLVVQRLWQGLLIVFQQLIWQMWQYVWWKLWCWVDWSFGFPSQSNQNKQVKFAAGTVQITVRPRGLNLIETVGRVSAEHSLYLSLCEGNPKLCGSKSDMFYPRHPLQVTLSTQWPEHW